MYLYMSSGHMLSTFSERALSLWLAVHRYIGSALQDSSPDMLHCLLMATYTVPNIMHQFRRVELLIYEMQQCSAFLISFASDTLDVAAFTTQTIQHSQCI